MNARLPQNGPSNKNSAIFQAADNLTLAAAPVFALMALLTMRDGGAHDTICRAAGGLHWNGMAWNGMVAMYILMSVAHLPPWLKLLAHRTSTSSEHRESTGLRLP